MIYFLVIHTRYKDVQIGLYDHAHARDIVTIDSKKMSRLFPESIDTLLKRHGISFSDISCIVAHQGPAPCTTLRVSLAITNALHYALRIRLIGVDGLNALLDEFQAPDGTVIALLNAFGKDLYYGIASHGEKQFGCLDAEKLIEKITREYAHQHCYMIGNGVDFIRNLIADELKSKVIIPESNPEIASIDAIARHGLEQWQKQEFVTEIQPLYLKNYQPHIM